MRGAIVLGMASRIIINCETGRTNGSRNWRDREETSRKKCRLGVRGERNARIDIQRIPRIGIPRIMLRVAETLNRLRSAHRQKFPSSSSCNRYRRAVTLAVLITSSTTFCVSIPD